MKDEIDHLLREDCTFDIPIFGILIGGKNKSKRVVCNCVLKSAYDFRILRESIRNGFSILTSIPTVWNHLLSHSFWYNRSFKIRPFL